MTEFGFSDSLTHQIAVLGGGGKLSVKEGGLGAAFVEVAPGVTSFRLAYRW